MEMATGRAVRIAGTAHITDKFFFFYVLADLRFNFFKVRVKRFNIIWMFYGDGIAIAVIPAVIVIYSNNNPVFYRVYWRAATVGDVNGVKSM